MFYGHNYDIVIGRWENLRIENGKLLADAVFDMKDPFAAEIARKIEEGFIKGVSVGIDIIAHSDDKQYKKPGQGLPAILQSELVEASIVPVPANSSSLKLGRLAKNLKLSAELSDKYIDLLFENNHTLNQNLNMKQIALKLGLKDDATEQDILSAIEKIQLANKKGIELVKNVIGKIFAKAGFKDEKAIDREVAGLKKLNPLTSSELTTRLKHMITSVDGNEEKKDIRDFVDNYFLAKDARAFREYVRNIQPDINMNVILDSGEEATLPIGLNFFWPDA
jgi:HK97 family phage prohead protease